jgi:hypothetical protein
MPVSARITAVLAFAVFVLGAAASAQEGKGGTIVGVVKASKNTQDGRNTTIEVLAPGEEKARSYFVNYDPKIKGPLPKVLAVVRTAKVGDRVELQWVPTNHGPAIVSFSVVKKDGGSEK